MRKLTTILAVIAGMIMTTGVAAASDGACHTAGSSGLTANYVNEVPTGPIDVTCDIGIYFDEDGTIDDVEINGTVADAKSVQFGVYIDGADVDVTNSTVTVAAAYTNQFVSVTYRNGATGTFDSNELSGAHRAALGLRGAGTDVTVTRNEIIGTGAKTGGWAENGIQVDQGAVASITHNTVADHWWDGESNWASTGIMLYGANDSVMNNNTLTDNEFAAYVFGNDNEVKANRVNANVESQSSLHFQAYGFLVSGDDNTIIGNQMRAATNAAVGIYLYPGSDNTIRGGNIKGFDHPIYDSGDNTTFTGNPALMN